MPSVKNSMLQGDMTNFGDYVRKYPTSFWGDMGDNDYELLVAKTKRGESILDKIAWYSINTKSEISGEILVGFVEGHMFKRPDSPLAKELGDMIDRDLSGLC